ncbi:transcriptional regulator [Spirochaetia bacterium]|nr:transcriptional regulator [Spirochaetia bacterium]
MGISYRPLFVLLASKGMKKTDLLTLAGISSGTLARFAKGESVSLEVIDKICKSLECQPGDIMEYVPDGDK